MEEEEEEEEEEDEERGAVTSEAAWEAGLMADLFRSPSHSRSYSTSGYLNAPSSSSSLPRSLTAGARARGSPAAERMRPAPTQPADCQPRGRTLSSTNHSEGRVAHASTPF